MIATCEEFANEYQIDFNPTKSKLICFNANIDHTPHIILNGRPVLVVFKDKHLGNYNSSSINDRHIIENTCDLYQRSNLLISQFRPCNSETLDRLHMTMTLVRFIYNSINHSNKTSSNILRVKLLCVNSTFSSNFQYLSFKYGLTEADWYINIDHLMRKVRKKMSILYPKPILCSVLKELCAIRDNITTCDIASITNIIAMIEDICTN